MWKISKIINPIVNDIFTRNWTIFTFFQSIFFAITHFLSIKNTNAKNIIKVVKDAAMLKLKLNIVIKVFSVDGKNAFINDTPPI
jgi:hypothetical protein